MKVTAVLVILLGAAGVAFGEDITSSAIVGAWDLRTYHYIEAVNPPVITNLEFDYSFVFDSDGTGVETDSDHSTTKIFWSLDDSQANCVRIVYPSGAVRLLFLQSLSTGGYLASFAYQTAPARRLEKPVQVGLMTKGNQKSQ